MFAKYSVRKPFTVLVGVILVIVLGVVSLSKMTTDLLPDMSFQYALIITTDMGASPEEVESEVTAPIESAIATTSNIKNVSSRSNNSYSIVTCEYEQSANMDSVVIEIQQKLDQLEGSWDDTVGTPIIMQINPDMLPVMMAAVDREDMDEIALSDYVNNELIPALESVEGVASVTATGLQEERIEVTLNQQKIDELNQKIQETIEKQFVDAQKEIDDAKAELDKGQEALTEGSSQISDAADTVTQQKQELYKTEEDLKKQLAELKVQREALEQAQSGIMTFLTSEPYLQMVQMNTLVPVLQETMDSLNEELDGIEEQLVKMVEQMDLDLPDVQPIEVEQIIKLTEKLASLQEQLGQMKQILQVLEDAGIPTSLLQNAIATVEDQILLFQGALAKLQNAINGVVSGVGAQVEASADVLIESVKKDAIVELREAMEELKAKFSELTTQLDATKAQVDTANQEIAKQFKELSALGITVEGYQDLPGAVAEIGNLITKVNTGITAIETGIDQIDSGKMALSDALDTIHTNAVLGAIQGATGAAQLVNGSAALEQGQQALDSAKDTALESADLENVLTIETLSGLLVAQNFDMPAGYAYEGDTQYLVRVGDSVHSKEELEELVLIDMNLEGIGAIRLSDVADIAKTNDSGESYTVINGNPGVALSMEKQTGYSTGEVTDRLLDRFDQLEANTDGLHLTVLMDQGVYIDIVVESVVQNMVFGAILAIIVLFLFLKDIKPTIVIACSIPLSVVASVVLMYFTGVTLNIISLSGMTLGIGMLVDNSIVVIENIYRLRSEGLSIRKAAVEGASRVSGAIIASTLTTISVYAPIIFTEGFTRQLFVDLSLTIAYTLLASLVVAMTFVPAMSSGILKRTKTIRHPWFDRFKEWYGRLLESCLRYKAIVFVFAVALLVLSGWAALSRGMTFMDMDMETDQMTVTVTPLEDEKLTFEELTTLSDRVLDRISDIEGIDTIAATAGGSSTINLMGGGSDSVSMYVLLDPDSKRTISDISDEITERTKDMECVVDAGGSSMDMTSMFGSGLSIRIKGSDMDTLSELAEKVAAVVEETEGCIDVKDGLEDATPQLTITVDKEKAAKYGYTVAQVYQLVGKEMADSGSATSISTDIKEYEVYLMTEEQSEADIETIKNLTFLYTDREGNEEEVALKDICTMEYTQTLSTIARDAQSRYLTVSCGIDEDHNVTLISNKVQKKLDELQIPEGYSITMEGEDETINDAMEQMMNMLILAVIFIYLIMVAQFQSLVSPFIIMFSIPLAFTGGFIALFLTGMELSVISMLGFVMLAGLIVNNGIVLIDYVNQARKEGMGKREAIVEAGKMRMRPILMTALTTILAMSTSAIGMGDGSAMMRPMAITIIGGLVYGTILTLIVIPCIYDALNREKSMVEEEI